MIKFIHFSDSHLGFTDSDMMNENGNNVREEDVYKAFVDTIDYIIETKPDFVIHSGDIFHRASPSNRALIRASVQLSRLAAADIPFYMIAGNHDLPKTIFTPPIHELYSMNPGFTIANDAKLQVLDIGNCILHLLPHINSEEVFLSEVNKIEIKDKSKPNILVMHLSISDYLMNEFGERTFPKEKLYILKEFDYVALGHWHQFNHLKKYGNVYYAGSSERTADSQTGYDKGFVEVGIGKAAEVKFVPLKLRRYEKIEIKNCNKKSKDEILKEIENIIKREPVEGGIFKIQLKDLDTASISDIKNEDFESLLKGCMEFSLEKFRVNSVISLEGDSNAFNLQEYFFDKVEKSFSKEEYKIIGPRIQEIWDEIEEGLANANN